MKKRVVIFGAGNQLSESVSLINKLNNIEIVAIIDNEPSDKVMDIADKMFSVQMPKILSDISYDKILIFSRYAHDIYLQLKIGMNVPSGSIVEEGRKWLAREYLLQRYAKTHDESLKQNLTLLKQTSLDEHGIFGAGYVKESSIDVLHWDTENNYPYAEVEGKRLYYPNKWSYKVFGDSLVKENIYGEQQAGSPHLYTYQGHEPGAGDVLVDAGACEGNFALRYIDVVSKCYLIECDPVWQKPLELTFAPYKDKVVFLWKYLSDKCTEKEITIDSIFSDGHEKIDFIKMDIEGAEEKALYGALETLKRRFVQCSVCTYHTRNAANNVKSILAKAGYHGQFSNGYMLFWHDPEWWHDPDYRKGIFYAERD